MVDAIKERLSEARNLITRFERLTFESFQGWAWLRTVKVGQTLVFDNGATSTKLTDKPKEMMFEVTVPPGSSFPHHWHDCKEMIIVKEGHLKDKILDYDLREGESVFIESKTAHEPYTPDNEQVTMLILLFKL